MEQNNNCTQLKFVRFFEKKLQFKRNVTLFFHVLCTEYELYDAIYEQHQPKRIFYKKESGINNKCRKFLVFGHTKNISMFKLVSLQFGKLTKLKIVLRISAFERVFSVKMKISSVFIQFVNEFISCISRAYSISCQRILSMT